MKTLTDYERGLKDGRTLGLQEALGAGPEKSELCRCDCEENKKTNWWNAGVDAKNSAISALIEKGEQGK